MAETPRPTRSRATSTRTARSAARPGRPASPGLHRSFSHLDDQSLYHPEFGHQSHEEGEDRPLSSHGDQSDDSSLTSSGLSQEEKAAKDGIEAAPETRVGVPTERELEAGRKIEKRTTEDRSDDPNLVTWESPDDTANPKNWSMKRKWAATVIVSCFTFISPVSSSMVAPSIGAISKEFGITQQAEQNLVMSIFVLAYAVGPLFLGPLSEIYGRVVVLQLANLFFLAWNIGCGFARNKQQMLAFRFLSGLGGSAPLAIGGGLLSDAWLPEQRGKAISIYSLAPLLGPAIGPVAGGFITAKSTWRWSFWSTSIVDAAIQVAGLFFLQETYAPILLKRKVAKLRKETGNTKLHTVYDDPSKSLGNVLRHALIRPFRLLGTQPIVQVLALYMAYLYGTMYLVLSTFPTLWTEHYGQSIGTAGLNYISLGLGFFLGTQISAPINDRVYRCLKKRNNNTGRPEFRVPAMVPASFLVPIGLFWYGWSAQAKLHWIMPNIGAVIFSAGIIIGFQCIQTYIVDAYTRYAASAIGAATVLRSLAGFGFPLFAPYLYKSLDYGWGNSLLAFLAIGLGVPAPFLFWKFGAKLRAKSQFAAGS